MKNILIISSNIQHINHIRRFFDADYKISGTNSPENAMAALKDKPADLVIYHADNNLSSLLGFYRSLRKTPETEKLPLIALIHPYLLEALEDITMLGNVACAAPDITADDMQELINSLFI